MEPLAQSGFDPRSLGPFVEMTRLRLPGEPELLPTARSTCSGTIIMGRMELVSDGRWLPPAPPSDELPPAG
jgi:hypothetical protein